MQRRPAGAFGLRAVACLVVLACSVAVLAVADPPAPVPTAPVPPAPVPEAGAETGHAVILRTGARIPCLEPPISAFGRVTYRALDGVRHALRADLVDLERTVTVPAPRPVPRARPEPQPVAAGGSGVIEATARRKALDFEAKRSDGTTVKLSDLAGKVVLVDFWATWCGPCVQDLPRMKALHAAKTGKNFEMLGVSLDHDANRMAAFTKAKEMTWPQAFDGRGWSNAVAKAYGVHSIPRTFVIDGQGRIAALNPPGPALAVAIDELLAELGSASPQAGTK